MSVLILAPAALLASVDPLPDDVRAKPYEDAATLEAELLATGAAVVLWSDGIPPEALETIAAAVRARTGATIEVRSERWDGFTASPVSAAARGVISGFGPEGVPTAAALLLAEEGAARGPGPTPPSDPRVF